MVFVSQRMSCAGTASRRPGNRSTSRPMATSSSAIANGIAMHR